MRKGTFSAIRYEDLSLNPYEMTQSVLQFYGLPFDAKVEEFLDTHTKVNMGGVSSTYRDSKSAPFHWKSDLKLEEVSINGKGQYINTVYICFLIILDYAHTEAVCRSHGSMGLPSYEKLFGL